MLWVNEDSRTVVLQTVCTYMHGLHSNYYCICYDAFAPQSLENLIWMERTWVKHVLWCLFGSYWIYYKGFFSPLMSLTPFHSSFYSSHIFFSLFSHSLTLSYIFSLVIVHLLSIIFCYLQRVNWVRQNCVAKCGEWQRLINNHKADNTRLQVYWHCISKP